MENRKTYIIEERDILLKVCGVNDNHLSKISKAFDLSLHTMGNEIIIDNGNNSDKGSIFDDIFKEIVSYTKNGGSPDSNYIDNVIMRYLKTGVETKNISKTKLRVGKCEIVPMSLNQKSCFDIIREKDIVFLSGPAGTGKTFLAIAFALSEILTGKKKRLILTRPVVEAGESLGFLPGDLSEKLSPYLRPLYDAIEELVPIDIFEKMRDNRTIEVAPLAYMRGRTLKNCYVVLDEAQNTTTGQMKMFLTRIGRDSKAIITGDKTQVDLPKDAKSGFSDALDRLKKIDGVGFAELDTTDVVRHHLVGKILDAYKN